MADRVIEELDEAESLRLISAGGVGRIAYMSRFGPAVLPVNYRWHDGGGGGPPGAWRQAILAGLAAFASPNWFTTSTTPSMSQISRSASGLRS